jgi:hypothetical protein
VIHYFQISIITFKQLVKDWYKCYHCHFKKFLYPPKKINWDNLWIIVTSLKYSFSDFVVDVIDSVVKYRYTSILEKIL